MDIRQYDVYIDGLQLPHWFLPDSDTQLGVRSDFTFDGAVARFDETGDASPVYEDLFAPYLPNMRFAELDGHTLSFRLCERADGSTAVRVGSASTNLYWQVLGAGPNVEEFGGNTWSELGWGERYVIYADTFGAGPLPSMTLVVRRCRVPLGDRSGELNRRGSLAGR